jgi:hypothetical protein
MRGDLCNRRRKLFTKRLLIAVISLVHPAYCVKLNWFCENAEIELRKTMPGDAVPLKP